MNYLKEILVITLSSLIGASISAIITILAGRRDSKCYGNLLYRARFWGLIFLELVASLLLVFGIFKD